MKGLPYFFNPKLDRSKGIADSESHLLVNTHFVFLLMTPLFPTARPLEILLEKLHVTFEVQPHASHKSQLR
jgi:hypothetical protein